jgi:hypothetical protein
MLSYPEEILRGEKSAGGIRPPSRMIPFSKRSPDERSDIRE